MGPLEQMYAILLQQHADRQRPVDFKDPVGNAFAPSQGRGPMPMRGPGGDVGPSPPMHRMFGSPTVRGNIDVMNRPQAMNPDGSISTVRSMGVNIGGNEVLIPTVSEDARVMGDDEAIDQYKRTGRHLGMFDSPESSTAYAGRLHDQQEALGDARALSSGDMGPEARRARRLTSQQRPMGPLASMYGGR